MTQPYIRANTDWLAACRYGLGVHWTAQTQPRRGPALPFAEAVAAFDREAFVESVAQCGADYVIFTTTHALQMLACPHPVVERLLPGRTKPAHSWAGGYCAGARREHRDTRHPYKDRELETQRLINFVGGASSH